MKRNSKVFFRQQVELILILNPFIKKLAEKLSALARIKKALSHPRSENIAVKFSKISIQVVTSGKNITLSLYRTLYRKD